MWKVIFYYTSTIALRNRFCWTNNENLKKVRIIGTPVFHTQPPSQCHWVFYYNVLWDWRTYWEGSWPFNTECLLDILRLHLWTTRFNSNYSLSEDWDGQVFWPQDIFLFRTLLSWSEHENRTETVVMFGTKFMKKYFGSSHSFQYSHEPKT